MAVMLWEGDDKMEALALTDYLTGLPNRRGLYDFYHQLPAGETVSTMFLDIDNFKKVNDTYGHHVGDELLVGLAKTIQKKAKDQFVARMSGDEFVIIVDHRMERDEIVSMAEDLLLSAEDVQISVEVQSIISLSIGVIWNHLTEEPMEEILCRCDAAMYHAKHTGKDTYVFYDEIQEEEEFRRSVEVEFSTALREGQFQVYLQPLINIVNSQVMGAETVARWHHPKDGVRMPERFLSVLEESGFIIDMDFYVFEQACKIRKSWNDTPLTNMKAEVAMAAHHLYHNNFVGQLVEIAKKYDVSPAAFTIEITENNREDKKIFGQALQGLKDAGFTVALRRFGSGISSLSTIREFDFDVIKMDEEFLVSDDQKDKRNIIVKNILSMARGLRVMMVVQGISNREQEQALISYGCDVAQGNYYSPPVSLKDFEEYYHAHSQAVIREVVYPFKGDLKDQNGENEGKIIGRVGYGKGIVDRVGSLYLPGGENMKNVVQLPNNVLGIDNFTVSMWIKSEQLINWGCVLSATSDRGFLSLMPYAWEKMPIFRVKDAWDDEGWYDAMGSEFHLEEWTHLCITFNARTALSRIYQNGVYEGKKDDVITLGRLKLLVLGGDYYQHSFRGYISDLHFYNYAMCQEEVEQMYQSYLNDPSFDKNTDQ